MIIKVLGPGCAKCHQLENEVDEVIKEMAIDAKVEKVSNMKEIMKYPVLMTPGLVINEKLVVSGKVPSKAEVIQYITNALEQE